MNFSTLMINYTPFAVETFISAIYEVDFLILAIPNLEYRWQYQISDLSYKSTSAIAQPATALILV